jgi:predicted ribosome quality control (RQC) complex YloA/Tae2 family protein
LNPIHRSHGEIGRHAILRGWCLKWCGGSNPPVSTKYLSVQSSFFILHTLAEQFQYELHQSTFTECFSPQADELCLVFTKKDSSPFYIKVFLKDTFQCISAPDEITKPKQNVHPYFTDVYGLTVTRVYAGANDRSIVIELIDGTSILFKMYANRSNVLLVGNSGVLELVKKVHARDWEFSLEAIHKTIQFTSDQTLDQMLKPLYLSSSVNLYLIEQVAGVEGEACAKKMLGLYNRFALAEQYYIQLKDQQVSFCLWNNEYTIFATQNLFDALNTFTQFYFRYNLFQERRLRLKTLLLKKVEAAEKYIKKTSEQLLLLYDLIPPNEIADIIMANMHDWPVGVKERELFDFYRNKPVLVQLKEKLSPQKMAEYLYKKSKNRHKQFKQLERIVEDRKAKQEACRTDLVLLDTISDYKQLHQLEMKYQKDEKASEELFPFKRYIVNGFEIWVGRNAANNELLTLKYAHKDDLWLHARNVPGSHVIIKYQSGKSFPQDVIEKAAALSAYYSTLKNDSLCPVSYTHKKYVRKFKGGALGSMKMEREDVIMVVPQDMKEAEGLKRKG